MANRQNTFLLKRSNVPGKIPQPGDINLGEIALNTADGILYTSGTTQNSILPIGWDRIQRTGDTVTGNFIINGNLGVTSISPVDYIDFNTNPTVPSATGGTVYFDANENALSYKPITNQNDVTVNLGQESLIRIYNDLPTTILNGQVLHITGATIGVPTVALANASKLGATFLDSLAQSSGVATHDIPSGEYGFMTNFGIVRDLNTTAFTVGSEVFLSDTVDGALTNDPNNIAFTSRISTVGYCLESNATTGKILVVITNENPLQSLTQQEINVLLGNTISTGAYFYTGATTASTTTINVSPMRGWIVYNTGPTYATDPLVLNVYYSGGTNIPVTNIATAFDTYLLVNSGGTLYQTNVFPSPQERRQNIFLGRVIHPNKTTILNVEQSVDYDVSPLSSLRDLWVPIKIINEGVVPSSNGANLTFKTSSGTFWANGIGFPTDELNPNAITVPGYLPASFYYTTQTGGTFVSTTTTVDTTKYDVGGVAVNVPGSGNYTTQRIYMSQSGVIRLQYGQNYYSTLAKAIAAIPSETFVVNPDNSTDCTLIGLLTVKDGTGNLSNTDDAVFTFVSKFGEILGGTAGISTTTLQQAYNNSVNPEITTNSTLGGVQFRSGTGSNTDKNIIIENNTSSETAFIRADGYGGFSTISASTYVNLPLDVYVTGGTYSNGTATFINNVGGLFSVTGFTGVGNLEKTLFVDPNGSDSTGTKGNLFKPFLTLEAAKNAAINGDLIYVFPGTYNVTTTATEGLAKDGISYYFSPNCIINKATSGDMFRANGFIYGFRVYGYGNFNKTVTSGSIFSSNNILVYGSITSVGSLTSGAGYTTGPKTTTGGSGTGFVVNVNSINGTGGITALSITNAGSTYKVGDVITINGGTSPATITITAILTEFNTDADISFEANDLYSTLSSSVFDIRSTARFNIKFNNLLSTNSGAGFFIESSNVNVNMYSISITNAMAFRGGTGSLTGMASSNLTVNGYQISATVNSAYVIALSAGSTAYFNVNFINYSGTGGYALAGNAATATLNVSSITSIFGQAISTIYLNGLCGSIVGVLNLYGGMVSLISGISGGDIDTVYFGTRSNGAGVTITISGGNVRLEMQNQDTTTGFAISGGIVRLRGSWANDDMGTASDLTGGTLIIEGDYEYGGPFYQASRFYGINVAGGTLIVKGTIRINSPSTTAYYSLDASPIQFTSGKVIIDGGTLISNVPQATPIRAVSANNSVTSIGNGVAGAGYTTGTKTTTTSGSGTGLTLSVTNANGITNTTIVSRGTNYAVGDTITVVGGSSPATFTITAISEFKVYAAGMNTNLIQNGGTLTGKKKKMKFTVVAVLNTQITLNDNLGSGNLIFSETNTVTYNTIPLLAQRMASLINASVTLLATATQDNPGTDTYFYVESDSQDLGFSLISYINLSDIGLIPGMYPLVSKVPGTIIEDVDVE